MATYVSIVGAQPEMPVPRSEGFGGAEGADDGGGIALVGVDLRVEAAHFLGGNFVGEVGGGGGGVGIPAEGRAAAEGGGFVGREVWVVRGVRDEVGSGDLDVG